MKKIIVLFIMFFLGGCVTFNGQVFSNPEVLSSGLSEEEISIRKLQLQYVLTYLPDELRRVPHVHFCRGIQKTCRKSHCVSFERTAVGIYFYYYQEIHIRWQLGLFEALNPFSMVGIFLHEFGHSLDWRCTDWTDDQYREVCDLFETDDLKWHGSDTSHAKSKVMEYWPTLFAAVMHSPWYFQKHYQRQYRLVASVYKSKVGGDLDVRYSFMTEARYKIRKSYVIPQKYMKQGKWATVIVRTGSTSFVAKHEDGKTLELKRLLGSEVSLRVARSLGLSLQEKFIYELIDEYVEPEYSLFKIGSKVLIFTNEDGRSEAFFLLDIEETVQLLIKQQKEWIHFNIG